MVVEPRSGRVAIERIRIARRWEEEGYRPAEALEVGALLRDKLVCRDRRLRVAKVVGDQDRVAHLAVGGDGTDEFLGHLLHVE